MTIRRRVGLIIQDGHVECDDDVTGSCCGKLKAVFDLKTYGKWDASDVPRFHLWPNA